MSFHNVLVTTVKEKIFGGTRVNVTEQAKRVNLEPRGCKLVTSTASSLVSLLLFLPSCHPFALWQSESSFLKREHLSHHFTPPWNKIQTPSHGLKSLHAPTLASSPLFSFASFSCRVFFTGHSSALNPFPTLPLPASVLLLGQFNSYLSLGLT